MAQTLQALERTEERLRERVGYTARRRHYTTNAALAGRILLIEKGTIHFRPRERIAPDDPNNGLTWMGLGIESIYDMIGYRHVCTIAPGQPLLACNIRQRLEVVKDRAGILKSGFRQLQQHLPKDTGLHLFILPEHATSKKMVVITIDGDYQVNEAQSARQLHQERSTRQLNGQIKSKVATIEAVTGEDGKKAVIDRLQSFLDSLRIECLPAPLLAPALPPIEQELFED
jgi:hypothetical protein